MCRKMWQNWRYSLRFSYKRFFRIWDILILFFVFNCRFLFRRFITNLFASSMQHGRFREKINEICIPTVCNSTERKTWNVISPSFSSLATQWGGKIVWKVFLFHFLFSPSCFERNPIQYRGVITQIFRYETANGWA